MSGTIFFTSNRNYMKKDPSSGTTSIAPPTTPSGFNYVTNFTVTHNLGFVPMYKVSYEPFGDGVIWSPLAVSGGGAQVTNPLNTATNGPGLYSWVNSTQLFIQLFYFSNTLPNSYPIYWSIYKDYTL